MLIIYSGSRQSGHFRLCRENRAVERPTKNRSKMSPSWYASLSSAEHAGDGLPREISPRLENEATCLQCSGLAGLEFLRRGDVSCHGGPASYRHAIGRGREMVEVGHAGGTSDKECWSNRDALDKRDGSRPPTKISGQQRRGKAAQSSRSPQISSISKNLPWRFAPCFRLARRGSSSRLPRTRLCQVQRPCRPFSGCQEFRRRYDSSCCGCPCSS